MAMDWNWYYNHINGNVTQMFGAEAALVAHEILGWHGPFATKADALAFYDANKAAHPSWQAPAESALKSAVDAAGSAVGDVVGKTVTKAQDVASDPFQIGKKTADLENWFIRGGEIVIGIVLIAVGLSHMNGGGGIVGSAFKVGKSAIKLVK